MSCHWTWKIFFSNLTDFEWIDNAWMNNVAQVNQDSRVLPDWIQFSQIGQSSPLIVDLLSGPIVPDNFERLFGQFWSWKEKSTVISIGGFLLIKLVFVPCENTNQTSAVLNCAVVPNEIECECSVRGASFSDEPGQIKMVIDLRKVAKFS